MMRSIIRKSLPPWVRGLSRRVRDAYRLRRFQSLRPLAEQQVRGMLRNELGLNPGDVVFVHAAVDRLSLGFPFFQLLMLLREAVGDDGTLLFPTFPAVASHRFLSSGMVFDVRRTPSGMGVLSEFARRMPEAVRSLHPTKSVCALGSAATSLTATHHCSPYPYDRSSPYFKMMALRAKVVGLGVMTHNLSFVHAVDDALGERFPLEPYHRQLFHARCIDSAGQEQVVDSYAHDLQKMARCIPRFMRRYVDRAVCEDLKIHGMRFFRADSAPLFERMSSLALDGITIYPRQHYSPRAAA